MSTTTKTKSCKTTILYLFLLLFFLYVSLSSSSHSPSSTACKSTPYPKLCRWMLSAFKKSSSSSPSKFSIKQCLKHASKLSKLINHHLTTHSAPADRAVADCAQLFELNVDYLKSIMHELRRRRRVVEKTSSSAELVGRVEALLSGVVTNQQTCYDGIKENGGWDGALLSTLHAPVVNGSGLYSASLGIVIQTLTPARAHRKRHQSDFVGRVLKDSDQSWLPSFKIIKVSFNL